jgi:glycine/D-amino acid oxidase-like deaminating enzyme
VLANAALAWRAGATLLEETVVREIVARGGEIVVRAESAGAGAAEPAIERAFDRVLVTAGPWVGALCAGLGAPLPLTVTRQELIYLRIARRPEAFAPGALPVWIDAATYNYGCPIDASDGAAAEAAVDAAADRAGVAGPARAQRSVKIGAHRGGEPTDPDRVRREPDAAYARALAAFAIERMPDLSSDVVLSETCLYTNTPDEDFVIDRAPEAPNVWIVSPCSGHGFKFAVLVAKVVAGLATDTEPPPSWLSRFVLGRFG